MMQIVGENPQIARALGVVSPKIGIVNNFMRSHLQQNDPNLVSFSATSCNVNVLTDSFSHLAGGAGVSWKDAFLATIGESVERYGSSFYDLDKLVKARARDLPAEELVAPSRYALFADEQYNSEGFRFRRFTEDVELYWDKATDLVDSRDKYVPASFLYMPFRAEEAVISEQISTGFAVHSDPYRALLSALFEVIERDAFTIAWMNLPDLPKFRIDGVLGDFVESVVPAHFELHLLDMTTDIGIPSVLGIMKGRHDFGDFIVVCASSRGDYLTAAKKTVIELCQSVPYFRKLFEEKRDYRNFSSARTFVDHCLFYNFRPDLHPVFDTWLNSPATVSIVAEPEVETRAQIGRIVQVMAGLGYPVLVKDKTTPDLADAGFHLVRAVCPGLIHLNGTFGAYYLGGERLYGVPVRMGYRETPNTYATLNPLPHPFP